MKTTLEKLRHLHRLGELKTNLNNTYFLLERTLRQFNSGQRTKLTPDEIRAFNEAYSVWNKSPYFNPMSDTR